MSYFVTGGAGFIGSHMVDALVASGPVTIFDNFSSGTSAHYEHHGNNPNLRIVKGQLGSLAQVIEAMRGHHTIVHYASNPDIARGMTDTGLDLKEGTVLTYNVLEAMRVTGAKTILYASGSGVYGDVGYTPTPEHFGPLLPISLYGASKLACEGLVSAFCHQFGMRGYVYRFANVVGRRQTHGVGFDFINKLRNDPTQLTILGDGSQSKSYIHVSDVIGAMLFVRDTCADNVITLMNVATDDYIDVTGIARIVIEEMGLNDVALRYTGGDRGWKGDVPKVRFVLDKVHALGWSARYSCSEAVRKSVREMLGKE